MIKWLRRLFKRKATKIHVVDFPKNHTVLTHPSDCIKRSNVPAGYDHQESTAVVPGSYIVMDPLSEITSTFWDSPSDSGPSYDSGSSCDSGSSSSDMGSSDFGGGSGDGGGAIGSWD